MLLQPSSFVNNSTAVVQKPLPIYRGFLFLFLKIQTIVSQFSDSPGQERSPHGTVRGTQRAQCSLCAPAPQSPPAHKDECRMALLSWVANRVVRSHGGGFDELLCGFLSIRVLQTRNPSVPCGVLSSQLCFWGVIN